MEPELKNVLEKLEREIPDVMGAFRGPQVAATGDGVLHARAGQGRTAIGRQPRGDSASRRRGDLDRRRSHGSLLRFVPDGRIEQHQHWW